MMMEFHEWARAHPEFHGSGRPWLILGKGPTFARRGEFDLDSYELFALNHVVREFPVTVAHLIDIDVARACGEVLADNAQWVILPRHPHVGSRPTAKLLEEFFEEIPVLRRLADEGRLIWYNLSNWPAEEAAPVVEAKYFSGEAAFALLGAMGVKNVFSLGVDGGVSYSPQFDGLGTCLANGQPSFSVQFVKIAQLLDRFAMTHTPLVSQDPLRIFVGTDDSQHVAAKVLEFTIRKYASRPVEFHHMRDLPTPEPVDPANKPKTGFSFYRFHIPRLCGFQGRGLYLDADMQVYNDITELFDLPFGDAWVMCTCQKEAPEKWRNNPAFSPGRQLSVMMLDTSKLQWDPAEIVRGLDEKRYTYKELMGQLAIVPQDRIADSLPVEWNHLEQFTEGVTRLTHYTVVTSQPWKNAENPLTENWMKAYREAVDAGFLIWDDVRPGIEYGHLRAELADAFPQGRAIRYGAEKNAAKGGSKEELKRKKEELAEAKSKLKAAREESVSLKKSAAYKLGKLLTFGMGK